MAFGRETTLDVVRGIAILLVLLFHLGIVTGIAALDRAIVSLTGAGWAGVDLFFVLSGFLVGRMILTAAASPAGFDRGRFLRRRLFRLWPVLFLYLVTMVLVGGADGVVMVVPVLLHIQNYVDHIPSHLWSLAVEEHFYLAAAIALPPVVRRYGIGRLGLILAGVLMVSIGLRMGAWCAGVTPQHLQWQTQYRVDAITLGVLIAWVELHRPDLFAALLRLRARNFGIAVVGYGLLVMAPTDSVRFGPGLIVADIASAALILAVLRAPIPTVMMGPARCLAALGGIAYPLYIWHASIARVADALVPDLGLGTPIAATLLRYAGSIAVATIIAVTIERPMMLLRTRVPPGAPMQNMAAT